MFAIEIHFLQGKYHATPWGKHVNEGIPEWPPAPWRLLRAIISAWKTTRPDLKDDVVWPILYKLAAESPCYGLPDASVSHTRHYMPADQKTSLVMDTFIVMGKKPVYVVWNKAKLSLEEIDRLKDILVNVHYLGRAESWCSMSVSLDHPRCNCVPLDNMETTSEQEVVRVLVPNNHVEFEDLDSQQPVSLKSITVTTKTLQDNNYADPPGSKWQLYLRPQNCFDVKRGAYPSSPVDNVTLVRYTVIGNVKPDIRDTLRLGDMARTACMSRYGKANSGESSATFSGKDYRGKPLTDHVHAFFLPTYETQNKKIDHITIVAKNGFDRKELDSLLRLRWLSRYNTDRVDLLFQGCGTLHNFTDIPIFGKGKTWVSATPLVLTRHIKYRGQGGKKRVVDGLEDQIRHEISERWPAYNLKKITVLDGQKSIGNTSFKPSEFFRWRSRGSRGSDNAYSIRLQFKESISGPLVIGYASHFGLGMFVPEESIAA